MRLWLDDVRPAPDGWVWVKTARDAIALLAAVGVAEISLDHDLGNEVFPQRCRARAYGARNRVHRATGRSGARHAARDR